MACYHRRMAFRKPGGGVSFDANDGAAFLGQEFQLQLKCGQCIGCRVERAREWTIRAVHEAQMHERNSFLTLTYSDEHLPDDRGLSIRHWQLFAKLVRKHCGPFRFLHAGEYSDPPELRPHYHALIFGHDWSDSRTRLQQPGKSPLFVTEELNLLWPHGYHTLGSVTFQSAAYVAKYIMKKITGKDATTAYQRLDPNTGECWDVRPEYATMSRRPGLGNTWFQKYASDVYPDDAVTLEGRQMRPPAYYDGLLKKKDPQAFEKIEERRRKHIKENKQDNTTQRLQVKEEIAKAKIKLHANK